MRENERLKSYLSLAPVFLQEGLFPPVLTIQWLERFQTHLWLPGRDPFQLHWAEVMLPAEPGSLLLAGVSCSSHEL